MSRVEWLLAGVALAVCCVDAAARTGAPVEFITGRVAPLQDDGGQPRARPYVGLPLPTAGAASSAKRALYAPLIRHAADVNAVDPLLVAAIADVESGFDPLAVSPKGAQGLMQVMPATGRMYGLRDPFDPVQNLMTGTRHLKRLLDRFGNDVALSVAAYNAGEGAVLRYRMSVPDYPETRDYVRRVLEKYRGYGTHDMTKRLIGRPDE
ncbi:lytic transglycosylase domain-containing protein [Trinickia mobilis]|uniref:lytic transglycosylase domain-containing protein n=1 Tax=Trinickia mobilis TaxID=2816356 RepID=UPI001A8FC445|nr:lytic transglycosylase domain-containing protein [Trinickia mobilis]